MSGRTTKKAGSDTPDLLADLRKQVTVLEKDLRARATDKGKGEGEEGAQFDVKLRAEYRAAVQAGRTEPNKYEAWLDGRVSQAAVAWVLGCVFVRFVEDNELIEWPFLAGPGDRLAIAEERHEEFFRTNPHLNDRDWIVAAFEHFAEQSQAAGNLFNHQHNPLWSLTPSFEAASDLVKFWRRRGPDGEVVHKFADADELDTRFLGDLYQDLSEYARKTYALLQTPVFVEEFILDLTLEPAVEEFGLEGLRAIDPACGSGHFLLGLFHRLLGKWQHAEPGTGQEELIRRALESVHGCDKNPFAVAIARFRLHVAALKAAGAHRLSDDHGFKAQIAVGDSLWHGGSGGRQEQLTLDGSGDDDAERPFTYDFEDVYDFPQLLAKGTYHVVVANPPYIIVQDKAENLAYRAAFSDVCSGKYSLAAPFAALLFELALRGDRQGQPAGFVGQITANSFMKREFGKKLIEDYFANRVELSHIIDTSGAYIPGHGTPTVILVGRNQIADQAKSIRAVFGVRGEPQTPDDPARGLVWSSIVEQVGKPGSESDWVSAEDIRRDRFLTYPWSVSGGGANLLSEVLNKQINKLVASLDGTIGFHDILGDDDVYISEKRPLPAWKKNKASFRRFTTGENVRDWRAAHDYALWPYEGNIPNLALQNSQLFWPYREGLRAGLTFGKTREERGMAWHEHIMLSWSRSQAKWLVAFASVSTHNHFVLSSGNRLHNRHAPVINLLEGMDEAEHLALLGVLNSSTACFWLKQVCHDKGSQGVNEGFKSQPWERFFEFTGTKLQEFPLPPELPLKYGQELDALARQLAKVEASAVCEIDAPTRSDLDVAQKDHATIHSRMIGLQEELDWFVYGSYNLLTAKEVAATTVAKLEDVPGLELGERAFEIVLARKMAAGEAETQWFLRHRSTPITELPAHWPDWYRSIVEARISLIESRKDLALIERPECKRRWARTPWDKKEAEALRTWLLDRAEDPDLWYAVREGFRQPRPQTVNQLADRLRGDDDFTNVASLYAAHLGNADLPLEKILDEILKTEYVPYLKSQRYKESGLRKRAQWESVWDLQREEDRTGNRLDIPVPPKYTAADFTKQSFWSHRGKLDVPKERFIGYPGASPDADASLLLGWAGWDHKDQGQALVNLVNDRAAQLAWTGERLAPLLDGLDEIMPWIKQWHGDYDPEWEGIPADDFSTFLAEQRSKIGAGQ